jgi:chorismate mutase
MQGLIIESHIDPSVAWTDAKQQLTPAALDAIMDKLEVRKAGAGTEAVKDALAELRDGIDKIDDLLIQKVGERMKIVEKIGTYKKDNGITILQVNRWEQILSKRVPYAAAFNLSKEFTEKFLELLHSESIRKQTEIMNKDGVAGSQQEHLTHA